MSGRALLRAETTIERGDRGGSGVADHPVAALGERDPLEQQQRPEPEREAPDADREDHDPGHDRFLRSSTHPGQRSRRRPRRAGRCPTASSSVSSGDRGRDDDHRSGAGAPQSRADEAEQAQRDDDREVDRVEAGPDQRADRDRGRPPDAEREPGAEEVAALLAQVVAPRRVPLGDRPRRVDDQTGGGDAEPAAAAPTTGGRARRCTRARRALISRPVRIAATTPALSSVRIAARCALPPKISQLPAQPPNASAVVGRDRTDDERERDVARRAAGASRARPGGRPRRGGRRHQRGRGWWSWLAWSARPFLGPSLAIDEGREGRGKAAFVRSAHELHDDPHDDTPASTPSGPTPADRRPLRRHRRRRPGRGRRHGDAARPARAADAAPRPGRRRFGHALHPRADARRRAPALAAGACSTTIIAAGTPPVRRTTFRYGDEKLVISVKPSHGVDALYAPRRTRARPAARAAAANAGVEVHHRTTVTDLITRDGRVYGVHATTPDGRIGRHRRAARDRRRRHPTRRSRGTSARRSPAWARTRRRRRTRYWSDLETDGYEWNFHPNACSGVIPTNDGQACVFVERDAGTHRSRRCRGHPRDHRRRASPSSRNGCARHRHRAAHAHVERAHAATSAGRTVPVGRSSATPATSRTRSARTGSPTRSATPSCSRCAVIDGFGDAPRLDDALEHYERTRDRLSIPLFDVVDRIAGHQWDVSGNRTTAPATELSHRGRSGDTRRPRNGGSVMSHRTLLGVWAHPDDEAYTSAGLMAEFRRRGDRVVVVTATLGERGTSDPEAWPPHRLAPRAPRRAAQQPRRCSASTSCTCSATKTAAASCTTAPTAIAAYIADIEPDVIVTFGPEGMTGHPDHRAVSRWTTDAWAETRSGRRPLVRDVHARVPRASGARSTTRSGSGPINPSRRAPNPRTWRTARRCSTSCSTSRWPRCVRTRRRRAR